jgi:hypothetical protein
LKKSITLRSNLVSCSFSREPPRKIPPFVHKSNQALLQI